MKLFNPPNPKVAVVIPVYKPALSRHEQLSLKQCCKVLGSHPIVLIKPHSLPAEKFRVFKDDLRVESFDDHWFRNVSGYNQLMLCSDFYARFIDYDYILIYQLDAFVFRDDLSYWCKKNYDYIGAPWLAPPIKASAIKRFKHTRLQHKAYTRNTMQPGTILPVDLQFVNKVGNGGFSLRKVRKFYEICLKERQMIDFYNRHNTHHFFNEDVFWSLEVNRRRRRLKIPGYKEASAFSIEFNPEYAFTLTKGKLPFGCHAWDLYSGFWQGIFNNFDYTI